MYGSECSRDDISLVPLVIWYMREAVLVVLSSMAQKTLDPEESSEKKLAKSHKKNKDAISCGIYLLYPNNQAKEVPFPSLLREWERGLRAENQSGTALRIILSWGVVTKVNPVERNGSSQKPEFSATLGTWQNKERIMVFLYKQRGKSTTLFCVC